VVSQLADHSPEAILIPGDLGSGHWDKNCIKNVFAPGGTYAQTVAMAGDICWTQLKYGFTSGGIGNVVAAVGDHDILG
jgi:hypothetical protein